MGMERVQKILAQAGITSRRKAEELIRDGLVTINGKVAALGDKAEVGKDAIKVQGKLLQNNQELVYLAFYKPKGVITAFSDPQDRPCLDGYFKHISSRIFPVGRLEFNSEGLLLLTNDGAFAEKIQKNEDLARVYQVKVKGHTDDKMLARLRKGAMITKAPREEGDFYSDKAEEKAAASRGKKTLEVIRPKRATPAELKPKKRFIKPHDVQIIEELDNKTVLQFIALGSGAFDVKGLATTCGLLVEKVTRTAIGPVNLKGIPQGKYRLLKPIQAKKLFEDSDKVLKELMNPTD